MLLDDIKHSWLAIAKPLDSTYWCVYDRQTDPLIEPNTLFASENLQDALDWIRANLLV